jgi:anti-sigma B factor antagonist
MSVLTLEIDVVEEAGVTVARLAGELDLTTVEDADARLGEATGERVIVDLSGLSFLDSAAVHLLFRVVKRFRGQGRTLAFVVPMASPAHRVVEILDLGSATVVRPSVGEALEAVGV